MCHTQHHTAAPLALLSRGPMRTTLQHTVPHCNTLHRTATHGNTRQHTATPWALLSHVHMCAMTYIYEWHASIICVTRHIQTLQHNLSSSYPVYPREPWHMHMRGMPRSYGSWAGISPYELYIRRVYTFHKVRKVHKVHIRFLSSYGLHSSWVTLIKFT